MVNQLNELNGPLWKLSVSQSISPLKKYRVDYQTILNQNLVVYTCYLTVWHSLFKADVSATPGQIAICQKNFKDLILTAYYNLNLNI